MIFFQNVLSFTLLTNSIVTVGLILNQNENTKDSISNSTTQISNPLENLTWFCVFLEFALFLLKSKIFFITD